MSVPALHVVDFTEDPEGVVQLLVIIRARHHLSHHPHHCSVMTWAVIRHHMLYGILTVYGGMQGREAFG